MSDLSVQQLRDCLTWMEENYSSAMDRGAYGLAAALKDRIDGTFAELVKKIRAEDPYTTEADVRHFERN